MSLRLQALPLPAAVVTTALAGILLTTMVLHGYPNKSGDLPVSSAMATSALTAMLVGLAVLVGVELVHLRRRRQQLAAIAIVTATTAVAVIAAAAASAAATAADFVLPDTVHAGPSVRPFRRHRRHTLPGQP
jgi:hypothetical protein